MLSDLLSEIFRYQIFRSILFRGGMGYLTAYSIVVFFMPKLIRYFRSSGITSDFKKTTNMEDYSGSTPIMGGVVLIPAIVISSLLWLWLNPYTVTILLILSCFSLIGLFDDWHKVKHKIRIENNHEEKKSYTDKSDGISELTRIFLESVVTLLIFGALIFFYDLPNPSLQIPFIPIKNFSPELSYWIYLPLIFFIVVGGANAVNMTDGLDSLVSIPLMTCLTFAGSVAYIAGDHELSSKLKIIFLSNDLKEISILCMIAIGTLIAFLKFNCPPASIYMGDVGSLAYGALVCSVLIMVKVELYIPIVGGIFFIAGLSSFIQRIYFIIMLKLKGRTYAETNRFFYKAPYHHHQQALYSAKSTNIISIYHQILKKFSLRGEKFRDKYKDDQAVNNKVIWNTHIKAIWLLIITVIIYFKAR